MRQKKESNKIPTKKLNPNYYKWGIKAQAKNVTDAWVDIFKIYDTNKHIFWDSEGVMHVPEGVQQLQKKLAEAEERFRNELARLEDLKEKAKDFHPDDLYIADEFGSPIRVKKGGDSSDEPNDH